MRPATTAASLLLTALAMGAAACGDSPQEPSAQEPSAAIPSTPVIPAVAGRGVDLGQCDEISAPAGSKLVLRAYAEGVQKYQWDNGTWAPRGPSANLYADAARKAKIGIHYGGPTWKSNGGSLVVGQVNTPCAVGPADIPWLLLDGVRSQGPGIFDGVSSIQRVNTVGGKAPSVPGTQGEFRNVAYTAEYFFYRAP